MLRDRCTRACRSRDARRPQASPSCLILLRQSPGPLSASGLTNCRQNRSAVCHPCQAGDEISAENAATDPRNRVAARIAPQRRSEEHTSELQSRGHLVCRLLLEKKKTSI